MNAIPRIQWAPRIKMAPLARLYQLDALGLQDEDLLTAFHFSMRQSRTFRPVASQLIAGSHEDVLACLDRLAQANYATGALNEHVVEWRQRLEKAAHDLPFLAERLEQARRINAQACQNASETPGNP